MTRTDYIHIKIAAENIVERCIAAYWCADENVSYHHAELLRELTKFQSAIKPVTEPSDHPADVSAIAAE
jgi:hypothetical protein